jgi:AraC-like DNA-binding protein
LSTSAVYPEIRRTSRGTLIDVAVSHPNLEFNLVISGRGTCFIEGRQHDLAPGTLLWIAPGEFHRLLRSPDFEMWVAIVEPYGFPAEMLDDVIANPLRQLSSEDALALDSLLSHVSQDADQPKVYLAGVDFLFRSAWHATISSPGAPRAAMHPAVVQALDILRSSTEMPTSAQLAHKCGVNQGYLGQLLIEQTGRGYVEWRNRTRIERFVIAYPQSGDLMTAAFDAGFGSYTQFHRVFSDLVGTTPGEWAKSGTDISMGSLASVAKAVRGSDTEGQRMVWYGLADLSLPAATRWLQPGFAAAMASEVGDDDEQPVRSMIGSWEDFRQFEGRLVESLQGSEPEKAGKLGRAFSRLDMFDRHRAMLGRYGLGVEDVANMLALYMGVAWYCVRTAPAASQKQAAALARRIRSALHRARCFETATDDDRRMATAAIVAQTSFLWNAIEVARASGNERILTRISDAARASVLATTGIDVARIDLIEIGRQGTGA